MYNRVNDEEVVKTIDYDSPSWAYKQAHLNGRREAFEEVMQILTIKPDQGE